MASFGKVARQPRLTLGSAISNAGVVAVSELVGASHCAKLEDGVKVTVTLGQLKLEALKCIGWLNMPNANGAGGGRQQRWMATY